MKLKEVWQRGQVLVFYALLVPLLMLFVGVAMDLGWYYLNVSRLQNAADAAALAGAHAIVKDNRAFDNYLVVKLASNELPSDFDDYEDVYKNTFDGTTNATGKLFNYSKMEDLKDTFIAGRDSVETYVRKNLSDDKEVSTSATYKNEVSAVDGWSLSKDEDAKKVSGTIELKYKIVDGKNDVYGPLYYVVNLEENIRHFFLPGWFDEMAAPVRAVVLLLPHNEGLITPMQALERSKIIDNWEYTNAYKDTTGAYEGKWNHYQAAPGLSGNSNKGIKYTSGNTYRTESVTVRTQDKNKDSTSSGTTTKANGNKFYSESEVDSINIDFRAEVTGKFKSDWDLGYDFPETGHNYQFAEGWSATDGADKRILFNADFDQSFKTRDPSKEADVLWTRIESDPLKNPYNGAGVSNFNSVRQITLNFNDNNTAKNSQGNYAYRPYVIFYTGPENIDYTVDPVTGVLIRHSQPVVVNLNDDTNAIMYFPNSPVVLNGNGHKLTGFIIAKCFLFSVTEEDMTNKGTVELYDGFNAPKNFTGDFVTGKDGQGQTVYFHEKDLVDMDAINAAYPTEDGATITTDAAGNILVKDMLEAPKYILLDYGKEDSKTYEVKDEDGSHNENKTFAAYVKATYKGKFKKLSGLNDSEISDVTFPDDGNYNFTGATFCVATSDLSNTKLNDNYVKVLVDGAEKYVDKATLPYVKVRTDKEYFYVCVYDLKLTESGGKGVRMIENSYTDEQMNDSYTKAGNVTTTDADVYVTPTSVNQYGDSWAIDRTWYNNSRNNWKKDKVDLAEKDGVRYFMLKSEINDEPQVVGKYKKITTLDAEGNEVVKYIRDDDDTQYYTKVDNNTKNPDNYIITDKNGNILTKTLTPASVLAVTNEEQNTAVEEAASSGTSTLSAYYNPYTRAQTEDELPGDRYPNIVDGQYRGNDEAHKNSDYRIPALERVYLKSTFNLSEDSSYSYFDIPELWRTNYTYMNFDEINHTVNNYEVANDWKVDDMFFTYKRANWID